MQKSEIIKNIKLFKKSKILCIGDVMLDEFIYGDVNRISPEAPVPILLIKKKAYQLGGTGNVARNICSLGGKVGILSIIGFDNNSNKFVKMTKDVKNIDAHFLKIKNYEISLKTRFVSKTNQLLRADNENIDFQSKYIENKFYNKFLKLIKTYNIVILSDYNKGLLSKNLVMRIIQFCKNNKKKILVDPKNSDFSVYSNVDIITPNLSELSLAAGVLLKSTKAIEFYAKKILKENNFLNMLVTRSEDGMTLITKNKTINFPTQAKSVYDVSGAGDTVIGVIALGISVDLNISDCIKLANRAAGIVVGKSGTAVATINEMLE